jgi:hypothetical protein
MVRYYYIDSRQYDTIETHYQTHSDERQILVKQTYVITNWGTNNPADYPSAVLGYTRLKFNLSKIEGFCYKVPAEMIAHVRVEKGYVHHPCAWGQSPLAEHNQYDPHDNFQCIPDCTP